MENANKEVCMSTLSIKVLIRMWNSLPPDEDCSSRKAICGSLEELCTKYPAGGEPLLIELVSLCKSSKTCCNKDDAKIWTYLEELVSKHHPLKTQDDLP